MENKMTDNPLKQYFRKPAIHSELPSKGEYYGPGALELPESGEVEIYPMTAIDEITYKTPDALFNGTAIVDVIKSCVPAIKDPWQMPTFDLNMLLIAIRIASIGHEFELSSMCPKCSEVQDFTIDLRHLLDTMPDLALYKKPLILGDLEVFFKPLVFKDVNENNKIQFEEQKIIKFLHDENVSNEEKMNMMAKAFRDIAKFSIETIGRSIKNIKTEESTVDDKEFISEYLSNCEPDVYEAIKNHLFKLKELEQLEELPIACENTKCKHEYKQPFTMDMTTFFERNS